LRCLSLFWFKLAFFQPKKYASLFGNRRNNRITGCRLIRLIDYPNCDSNNGLWLDVVALSKVLRMQIIGLGTVILSPCCNPRHRFSGIWLFYVILCTHNLVLKPKFFNGEERKSKHIIWGRESPEQSQHQRSAWTSWTPFSVALFAIMAVVLNARCKLFF
jgi:hypothetical protein